MERDPSLISEPLLDHAIQRERARALTVATTVRLGAALAFLVLSLVMRGTAWTFYTPMLAGYAVVALAFFLLRHRPISPRLAWLSGLIDVGAVYVMQREVIPISELPRSVASFSVGPFTLMLALSALTLQARAIVVAAVAAAIGQALLMQQAQLPVGTMVGGAVILLFMAVVALATLQRLRFLVVDLSETEVRRHLEQRRRSETDAAKTTMERMLAESREQNERLGRLQREKESLVQLIVHDLRSPLNAVMLSLEYVAQEVKARQAGSDLTEALEDARTTAHRVSGMVSQILDTSKLEEGRLALDRSTLPAADLLKKVRQQLAPMARDKRVDVRVDAPSDLALRGDPRLFGRVIENLLSNSIRHTPAGGRILLAASRVGNDCRLSVHNNGEPIDPQDRERIFAKFQQGNSEGARLGGWGLGLYFCRMVVEAHGGHITVEDVDDWSASFVLVVPAEAAPATEAPASALLS
jgi:two-component system, OmpR family, heavy metal sensor histidine kinase CusS